MKKTKTLLGLAGLSLAAAVSLLVGLIPAAMYGFAWWHMPKTFWWVLGISTVGLISYLAVQFVWLACLIKLVLLVDGKIPKTVFGKL